MELGGFFVNDMLHLGAGHGLEQGRTQMHRLGRLGVDLGRKAQSEGKPGQGLFEQGKSPVQRWANSLKPEGRPSGLQDQNRSKVIHVGVRGACDHQITQGAEVTIGIVAV